MAACKGDVAGILNALRDGAHPDVVGKHGITPLLTAVACENTKGVQALLKAGADPNLHEPGHSSPTLRATVVKNPAVLKILLASGGDPNAIDGQWTAFRYALAYGVQSGNWANYYTLLNGGGDINRARDGGETVALDAVTEGQFDKTLELLQRGYNRDLECLGGAVQVRRANPGSQQAEWKQNVISALAARGVNFPVPPLHRLCK